MPGVGPPSAHEHYFVRLTCRSGQALRAATQLAESQDVRFVTLITGEHDIIAEVQVRREAGSYNALVADLHSIDGVEAVSSELLLHVYKVSHDWSRGLLGLAPDSSTARNNAGYGEVSTDASDDAILEHLRGDGRASFAEVAEAVGLNESTVRRRFERMLSRGSAQVVTLVQAAALGFESEVQLRVQVEPARLTEVAHRLAEYRQVRYLALALGSNALVSEVIASSTEDLHSFITSQLAELPGVIGWSASLELLTIKRGFVETPWWRKEVSPENVAQLPIAASWS